MERTQVTNGCSGGCCEKFTLPVTINDLQKMKAEYIRAGIAMDGTNRILCDNGMGRYPCDEKDLDLLIAMLIPLGTTNIDPQFNVNLATKNEFDPEKHDAQMVLERTRGHNFISKEDGTQLLTNIFTCKHFDTVNKVCGNYENRPRLCRDFGHKCGYTGCGFGGSIERIGGC